MQMIRKNINGITMISLIITIIVLSIIIGISLNYGLSELHNVENKKTESELEIVQEAVMQRYALVKSQDKLGIIAPKITTNKPITDTTTESERPEGFVGDRIADPVTAIINVFPGVELINGGYTKDSEGLTFEQYYYALNENDLRNLGIEKGEEISEEDDVMQLERTYIVNYLTGEVFDTATKKYYKTDTKNDDPVYTQPTIIEMNEEDYNYNDD